MRSILLLATLSLVFLSSCKDEDPVIIGEVAENQHELALAIDGTQFDLDFSCEEAPDLYAMGMGTDLTTGKFIFDQGYLTIPVSIDQTLKLNLVMYTEMDIRQMEMSELVEFLEAHPETLHFDVAIEEGDKLFKNIFYGPGEFEERAMVAEDETITYAFAGENTFDCLDNWPSVELNLEYKATLKTEDITVAKEIDVNFDLHMRAW